MFDQRDKQIIEIPERRKIERFAFSAVAEVFEIRSQAHIRGRCSDLSMGGCYVDTMVPFAVDSALRITIQHDLREFQALAIVTYCLPSMGMGIKFTDVQPEFRDLLRYWVGELSGKPIPKPEPLDKPSSMIQPNDADSAIRLILNELVTLLVRKKIITEVEGAELLIRAFR